MGSILDERAVGETDGITTGTNIETRLMAKALAGLFAAGATLGLASILLPHDPQANELGMGLVVGDAYAVA
ncbi:MAG: hypothetical protein ABR536_06815, partial [Solirubrobacterales bacterium]